MKLSNNESRGKIVICFLNINKYHLKVLKDGGKEQPLDIIFAIRLSIYKIVSPEKWKLTMEADPSRVLVLITIDPNSPFVTQNMAIRILAIESPSLQP